MKHVDLAAIGDGDAALSFFLNLYHCMVIHVGLLLEPKQTAFTWAAHAASFCYEVGGDVVSLAEVEFTLIRRSLPVPHHIPGQRVLVPRRALFLCCGGGAAKPDPRVVFAVNSGSRSALPIVPVYTPLRLQAQLDAVSRLYVQEACVFNATTLKATLPLCLHWSAHVFRRKGEPEAKLVQGLSRWFDRGQALAWARLRDAPGATVRFVPHDWTRRAVGLVDDASLEALAAGGAAVREEGGRRVRSPPPPPPPGGAVVQRCLRDVDLGDGV